MPLPVKWVGEIPVISMQDFTIPGLGTFSAHVVIDRDKYAGTWAHGNKIQKQDEEADPLPLTAG